MLLKQDSMLKEDTLEEILSCPTLPSLPAVAVRVIELTRDENVSLDELALTIQNDQGLAAKVLRTVNSSYYGLREKCSTIRKALVLLGLNAVKSLALGFSLVEALQTPPTPDDPFDYMAYWRRGLYTAVGARSVAAAARLVEADEAFLGGLLQDVGMYAMKEGLKRAYLDVYVSVDGDHTALASAETAAFQVNHADIGALLTERWRLPESLVMPVKYHERATACPLEHRTLARAVAVGNLAHDVLSLKDKPTHLKRYYDKCKSWFNIDYDRAEELLKEIADGSAEMSHLFKLETGAYTDPQKVISEARTTGIELTLSTEDAPKLPDTMQSLISGDDDYDPITGLLTEGPAASLLEEDFSEALKSNEPLSAVRIMVNGIPPLEGETVLDADRLIIAAANLIRKHFEQLGGVVARTGNTRFDVIISGQPRNVAAGTAEAFRTEFDNARDDWITTGRDPNTLSVCLGIAALDDETRGVFKKPEHLTMAIARAVAAASTHGGTESLVRVFRPKKNAA